MTGLPAYVCMGCEGDQKKHQEVCIHEAYSWRLDTPFGPARYDISVSGTADLRFDYECVVKGVLADRFSCHIRWDALGIGRAHHMERRMPRHQRRALNADYLPQENYLLLLWENRFLLNQEHLRLATLEYKRASEDIQKNRDIIRHAELSIRKKETDVLYLEAHENALYRTNPGTVHHGIKIQEAEDTEASRS